MFLLWKTKIAGLLVIGSLFFFSCKELQAQENNNIVSTFRLYGDVSVTIDRPSQMRRSKETIVILFALPNGNSTAWTIGKKMETGDDWHFDIQHIGAQTSFIRKQDRKKNYVVIYLENDQKSWPAWKQEHPEFRELIPKIVDSLSSLFNFKRVSVHLNGHSGGGSFIFGYLAGIKNIPSNIRRITFLDSNYGYDSSYLPKIAAWLTTGASVLNVFAYNDSVALLNGKSFVSARGGTWHRSRMMREDLQYFFPMKENETDSLIMYRSPRKNIHFFMKKNLNRGIYHTQQVELNGFIHSVFVGTRLESKQYEYYGERAYTSFIH